MNNEQLNSDLNFGRKSVSIPNDEKEYSIRIPTAKEQYEARLEKSREYNKLLRDENYLTKAELIDLYKQRGQDIVSYEIKIKELKEVLNKELLELAKIMNKEEKQKKILELTIKIENLKQDINDLLTKETKLFENCIENLSVLKEHYSLISSCIEVKEGNEYKKVYSSIEEFLNDKDTSKGLIFTSQFLALYYGYGVSEYPFVNWLGVESGN